MSSESSKNARVFFAINLSEDTQQSVVELIHLLQTKHPSHSIRWTKPQNLHITLQFLGSVIRSDIDPLIEKVGARLKGVTPFEISFDKLELFPTKYRPSVISLRSSPNEPPAELARLIGEGIVETGYEIERRPFRSHLTLARLDRRYKDCSLDEIILPDFAPFQVNEIVLYESQPTVKGSIYTAVSRFDFGKH